MKPSSSRTSHASGLQRIKRALIIVLLLLALTAIYCSNLRLIAAGDSLPTTLVSLSLILDNTLTLDRVAPWLQANVPFSDGLVVRTNGHYHSIYPAGQALLAVPFIAPAAYMLGVGTWQVPRQVYFARIAEKLSAALMTSLTVVVVFFALRCTVTSIWAWALTVVFALGTSCWPIASQALWQQTGGQLCIALTLWLFQRWLARQENLRVLLIAGICCAMAIVVRPTNFILVGAVVIPILLWHRPIKSATMFLTFPIVGTVLLAVYNLHVYSNVFGGYGQFLSPNRSPIIALAGILVSPGRGLFFFSPVLLLAFIAPFQRCAWQRRQRSLVLCCLLLITGQLAVISSWPVWWGGYSWGWRLLTEIGPPLIVLIGVASPLLTKHRLLTVAFWILAVVSVSVQAVGAFCYPSGAWDASPSPVDASRVWNLKDNPISRSVRAGIDWQPYRSFGKLFDSETWTLAHNWETVSPNDIVAMRWWAFPTGPKLDDVMLHSLPRYTLGPCYLDVTKVKLTDQGIPLSLEVVGWAFDAKSKTVPPESFIELSSVGSAPRIASAERWDRPDIVRAFRNDRLLSAGVSANIALDQPVSATYDIKILQLTQVGLGECVPAQAHVVLDKSSVIPALPFRTRVLRSGDAGYLVSGWTAVEPGFGVWSTATESVLAYRGSNVPAKSLRLTLIAIAGRKPVLFSLVHELGKIDEVVPPTAPPRIETFTVRLPIQSGPGLHRITILTKVLLSPADQGYNSDIRKLGIGVRALGGDGCSPSLKINLGPSEPLDKRCEAN